ncbi:hypothetical protein ACG7TL_000389 [Trametes sanguinea]
MPFFCQHETQVRHGRRERLGRVAGQLPACVAGTDDDATSRIMRHFWRLLNLGLLLAQTGAVNVNETSSAYTFVNDRISFNVIKNSGYIRDLLFDGISVLGNLSGNAGQLYTDFPGNAFALTGSAEAKIITGRGYAGIVLTDNDTTTGSLPPFLDPRPSQTRFRTWYLGLTPSDPYVQQESDYFTKYSFADNQTNKAHGLYGQGPDGIPIGAWWVVNQKDTFFGGPFHVDLMVDGIIYNKLSTNHGGATNPNVTNGFDRTFGPQFLYLNRGHGSSLQQLLTDAEWYADPSWNVEFYDEIAPYVHGYVPSKSRGSFSASIQVPHGAKDVVAILSANGVHFQDSAADPTAYQYFAVDVQDGIVNFDRVKAGTYRLTIAASDIFGDYVQDNIVVKPGKQTHVKATWVPESAGVELWRIGTPDKTSGEFRNGWERDLTHPRHPSKYRIFWGAWDFPNEFPGGVNFTVGHSVEGRDWNYVHWSQYGPTYTRNDTVTNINRWTINFEIDPLTARKLNAHAVATFTIQLAAAKTTSGNTDVVQGAYPNFPRDQLNVYVNNESEPLVWTIQWFESSSCAERSAISCHILSNKLQFPGTWLQEGHNSFVLELPHAAPVYVQYDALRLELQ